MDYKEINLIREVPEQYKKIKQLSLLGDRVLNC